MGRPALGVLVLLIAFGAAIFYDFIKKKITGKQYSGGNVGGTIIGLLLDFKILTILLCLMCFFSLLGSLTCFRIPPFYLFGSDISYLPGARDVYTKNLSISSTISEGLSNRMKFNRISAPALI